jgi:ribosome biogenesis protein UTP30
LAVVEGIKGGWENIQSRHLKTGGSVALPIWTCGLGPEGDEGRWNGLAAGDEKDSDDDEMEVDEVVVKAKETVKDKGTKRLSEEDTLQGEKPKKKVRSAQPTPPMENMEIDLPVPVTVPKKKKSKSSPTAGPTPIVVESSTPPAPAAEVEVSKKKKRKSIVDSPKSTPVLPTPTDPFPTDVEAEADIDTEATERPIKPKKAKQKSKSRASLDLTGEDVPTAITDLPSTAVEASPLAGVASTIKRRRGHESIGLISMPMQYHLIL